LLRVIAFTGVFLSYFKTLILIFSLALVLNVPSVFALTVQPNSTTTILSKLPSVFEQNQGQFDPEYPFLAQTPETFFAFAKDHVNLVLNTHSKNHSNYLQMRFEGANDQADLVGLHKTVQKVNYLRGKKQQWLHGVSTYTRIKYREVYPGIDLLFRFSKDQMEFDFVVSPGSDPNVIAFTIENAESINLTDSGELKIGINGHTLTQKAPVLFQEINGNRVRIDGRFRQQDNKISFQVGDYNSSLSLVIDPVIEFSSYFGGEWEDQANAIKADSQGNMFVAGATSARARITVANILTSEAKALPIKKILLPGDPIPYVFQAEHGISLDEDVLGGASLDLAENNKISVINNTQQTTDYEYACDYHYRGFFSNDRLVVDYDGFLSKFTENFDPIFTTYIGGCLNDAIRAMAIDVNDNVYVTGLTVSDDFPVKFPAQVARAKSRFANDPDQGDAFYAKFDNDGVLIFASYLGGDGQDGGRDIAVDADENIYLVGYSHSLNLATNPCPDAGQRTIACENIGGIDEAANDAGSQDISVFSDAFVAKILSDGDVISFLTYYGGKFDDWGQSIWVQNNEIYIAGNTASPDLPVGDSGNYSYMPYNSNRTKDKILTDRKEIFCTRLREEPLTQLSTADAHVCQDVFLAKLSGDGSHVIFSTYFGGDDDDNVSQITLDSFGNIYLVGTSKSKGVRLNTGAANSLLNEDILEVRFPLFKNINDFKFDLNSIVTSAFLAVFNPMANKLIFSTFVGGNGDDTGNALAIKENPINGDGDTLVDIYIAGHTQSDNFYTSKAFQSKPALSDIYLVKLVMNLGKANDVYDPVNPSNPDLCSANSCNLYNVEYSTLFGGEDLDSLKSIALLPDDKGLVIAGISFSTNLPITSDAVKTGISGINEIQYDPFSRAVIDQFVFHPSDAMLLKISDTDVSTELGLTLSLNNSDDIRQDETINYSVTIENKSATMAEDVRFLLTHPYVSKLSELSNYINFDLPQCQRDIKQLYCILGNMAANQQRTYKLDIVVPNSGDFILTASLSSRTADTDSANNSVTKTVKILKQPGSAIISPVLLMTALLMIIIVRKRYKRSDFRFP